MRSRNDGLWIATAIIAGMLIQGWILQYCFVLAAVLLLLWAWKELAILFVCGLGLTAAWFGIQGHRPALLISGLGLLVVMAWIQDRRSAWHQRSEDRFSVRKSPQRIA